MLDTLIPMRLCSYATTAATSREVNLTLVLTFSVFLMLYGLGLLVSRFVGYACIIIKDYVGLIEYFNN